MTEPDWLAELADVAREREAVERAFDERWDRLAGGELSPEEAKALRELAAESPAEADRHEAFRPLGPVFETAAVAAVLAQRRAERDVAEAAEEAGPREAPAGTLSFRPPRGRTLAAVVALAAAAAVAFVLVWRPPVPAPLPTYRLALAGVSSERGGVEEDLTLRPGSRFELTLHPDVAVDGAWEVSFWFERAGELEVLELSTERAASGAVRVRCRVGEEGCVPSASGALWVLVGRPSRVPKPASLRASTVAAGSWEGEGDGWRGWKRSLRVEAVP